MEHKLTPAQRAALKLKIGRKMEQDQEFAKRVQILTDEISESRNFNNPDL